MASIAASMPAQSAAPFTMRSILAPLIAIVMGTFMVILDMTAVNVSLPTLVHDFHSTIQSLQWILTGYTLAQAAVIPLAGWLSDRFGAKRVFLTAIGMFTIGSLLCSTAQSTEMLIAFRILQGLGGGFVMPVGMAYTYRLSPPDKRGMVMGTLGVPMLLAPALGPTLAGWLVQYADWRWIFLINLPVGIVALLVGARRLPFIPRQTVPTLDLPGMLLAPLAFASISYGMNEGATSWSSANTIGGLAVGFAALAAFIVVELRVSQPLLELRVFRSIDFSLAIIVQWIGAIALFGGIFLVPLFMQQIRGYGAFDTGLTLMAQALAAAFFMPIGGRLFDRFGARPLAIFGLAEVALASFMLAHFSSTTTGWNLVAPLAMRGMGMALMMMPLNTHLLNSAPRNLVGRVTSLTNALQNVVNSLAIATLSTVLASKMIANANAAKAALAAPPPAVLNGWIDAYNSTLMLVAAIALAGALLSLALRREPRVRHAVATAPAESHISASLEALAG